MNKRVLARLIIAAIVCWGVMLPLAIQVGRIETKWIRDLVAIGLFFGTIGLVLGLVWLYENKIKKWLHKRRRT